MADQIVTIKFVIDKDGSLKQIANEAEGAAKATEEFGEAAEQSTKSARSKDRALKGLAQTSANNTKNNAKMAQGISGGLVPAYATLAANVFALSAAFNFLKKAADVRNLEESQVSYATNTGMALSAVTQRLREASSGMLGFREAAQAAAIGVAKGFSPKQLEDLAKGAKKASTALGRGFEDSFDRLLRGASKAEPELLDELGITLRLADATENYAAMIGKQADELTTAQRSQAVLLETQRQLDDLFGAQDPKKNAFVELSKTFEDLVQKGTQFFLPMLEGIANVINRSAIAAIAVFGALGIHIMKQMPMFDKLGEKVENYGKEHDTAYDNAKQDVKDVVTEIGQEIDAMKALAAARRKAAAEKLGGKESKSKTVQALAGGEELTGQKRAALKAALKRAEAQYKQHGKVISGVFEGASKEALREMRKALDDKWWRQWSRVATKSVKVFGKGAKVVFKGVKAAGVGAMRGIAKAAIWSGKLMGKAFKIGGIIGAFVMLFETLKGLMSAPFDIAMSFMRSLDNMLDAFAEPLNWLSEQFTKFYNWFIDKIKSVLNFAISAANIIPGIEFKPLPDDWGKLDKDMLKIEKGSKRMEKGFLKTGVAASFLTTQLENQRALQGDEAMDDIYKNSEAMQNSLNAMVEGLREKTGAEKEHAIATNLGSLGILAQAKSIKQQQQLYKIIDGVKRKSGTQDLLTAEQQKAAWDDLLISMKGLKETAPAMYAAIAGKDVKEIERLQTVALDATSGFASLKDETRDFLRVLGEDASDFSAILYDMDQLEKTAKNTADSYTELNADSKKAAEVKKYLQEALKKTGETWDDYKESLEDVVKTMRRLERQSVIVNALSGESGRILKDQLAISQKAAAIEQNRQEYKTASAERKQELDEIKKKLDLELAILKAKKAQNQGLDPTGAGMTSTIMGSDVFEDMLKKEGSRFEALHMAMAPMISSLEAMGPEGKAMAQAINGFFVLGDAIEKMTTDEAVENLQNMFSGDLFSNEGFKNFAAGAAEMLKVGTAMVAQMGAIHAAKSAQVVAGIEREIEAEKKRDGKSKESVAKIKALEAKKEAMKRQAFEKDKKYKAATAAMATAQGMMQAIGQWGWPMGFVFAALIAAMGAQQIAMINSMQYQGGASTVPDTPSTASAGKRRSSIDIAKSQSAAGELSYLRGAQGIGGPENFQGAFYGKEHRAEGGSVGYVVGEQGPELFMPEQPGTIIPNDDIGGMGTNTNVTFNISTIDAVGVEDVLTEQQGNIIGMIRSAANEYGDPFLENVDTSIYSAPFAGYRRA